MGLDYKVADQVPLLAVVECVGERTIDQRTYSPLDPTPIPPDSIEARLRLLRPKDRAFVESVRVVDSTSLPVGRFIRVVTPIGQDRAAFRMRQGSRYLLLGSPPKDGLLGVPCGTSSLPIMATPALAKDEVSGWAVFETKAKTLSTGVDAADRIVNSIADTLTGADDAAVRRTTAWFESAGYPGGGRSTNPRGRADFPLSLRMRSLADHAASDYQRARIFQVLCEWEVVGAERPFVQAVIAASRDPLACTNPGDLPPNGVFEYSAAYALDHPGYKGVAIDGNSLAESIVSAKSKPTQAFLLMNTWGSTDLAHDKALAKLLVRTDEWIGHLIAIRLANNENRPDLMPKMQDVAGRTTWINRQMVTEAWRSQFGIAAP